MGYDVWIFTLGNEVVEGRVINTNASYLGRRLTLLGFKVRGVVSLPDDVALISSFISYVLRLKPRVIVTTGGLGPTYDDRTLEAVARALGRNLLLNAEALSMVKAKYSEIGLPITEERLKMAKLPEGASPIPNPVGTAPGSWLVVDETIIVSLPGVPKELEAMWSGWVEPRLKSVGPGLTISEGTIKVVGVPESTAAAVVKRLVKEFSNVYIKTHPRGHEIRGPVLEVYVMTSSRDPARAAELVSNVVGILKEKFRELGGDVVGVSLPRGSNLLK